MTVTIYSLSPVPGSHPPEARYSGTELVMLYDYKAQVVIIFFFIFFIILTISNVMVIVRPLMTCQYVGGSGCMPT